MFGYYGGFTHSPLVETCLVEKQEDTIPWNDKGMDKK